MGTTDVVKNDNNIQWKDIHIMVTSEQKAIIDRKADEAGLSVAAFLRTLAMLYHLEVVPNADRHRPFLTGVAKPWLTN